jgi:YVTN family beta-propeller protein
MNLKGTHAITMALSIAMLRATIVVSCGAQLVEAVKPLMYVANFDSDTVSVIKIKKNTVTSPIAVGDGPMAIAFDPTHKRMYVTNSESDTVSVIKIKKNTVTSEIALGDALAIAFDTTHKRMYVTGTSLLTDTVSVIDTYGNNLLDSPIAVGGGFGFHGIAFDPTHKRMYITNSDSDKVSVIDTNTNALVGSPLVVGKDPEGIAFAGPQH